MQFTPRYLTVDQIDQYGDYKRVESADDLIGPGDRIYIEEEWPAETRRPTLRMMKIERAVVAPRKNIINLRNGKLLLDAQRKPHRVGFRHDPRRPEEEPSALIEAAAAAPAVHLKGYNYLALSRHGGYGHFLLEGMSQLWGASKLDISAMRCLTNFTKPSFAKDIVAQIFGDRVVGVERRLPATV